MINIKIETKSNGFLRVTAVGHAGDEKEKSDVVCAAHSMIAAVLYESYLQMHAEGKLRSKPKGNIDSGYAYITAYPKDEYYDEALHCLWFYTLGAAMLEKFYPQYVKHEVSAER